MTTTRSTAKAGEMKAGANLAAKPVGALLADVTTTTEADQLRDLLAKRLADAEAAAAAHGDPDPILEEDDHAAHASERDRLAREVERVRAGLDRLAERRAELATAEAQAAARAKLSNARNAAALAETLVAERYPGLIEDLRTLLAGLAAAQHEVREARDALRAAGLGELGAELKLPHERRSHGPEFEERIVESPPARVGTFDAEGREVVAGGSEHFGPSPGGAPMPTRRRESVQVRRARHAPDLVAALAALALPDPTDRDRSIRLAPGRD